MQDQGTFCFGFQAFLYTAQLLEQAAIQEGKTVHGKKDANHIKTIWLSEIRSLCMNCLTVLGCVYKLPLQVTQKSITQVDYH